MEEYLSTKIVALLEQIARSRDLAALPLWDSNDVSLYLRRSRRVVVERIVCLPDFPAAIRINGGLPLWEAKEVMAWALSHKETNKKGRPRDATLTA